MTPYVIYGFELSYFTRKTEAAFQLVGVPHIRKSKTLFNRRKLERFGQTQQVPVVRTPSGDWMADSTPIIEHLDQGNPSRRLFPTGVEGVLPRLCEEWLDEWFPRVVIHFRWNYPECAQQARHALARELLPYVPSFLRNKVGGTVERWGKRAARALALDSDSQQRDVESLFERIFEALESQLAESRFCLGDRPCAADAVLLGAIRAHLQPDPESRRRLQRFPKVLAWASKPPDWTGAETLCSLERPNTFARCVLREIAGPYASFIRPNAEALEADEKAVLVDHGSGSVSYRSRPYPEVSRQRLTDWLNTLDDDAREAARIQLSELGLADIFPIG